MKHIFTVLFVCLVLSAHSQSVIYVTPTGAGNQSGGSWSDALPGLQLQGRLASAASGAQFWIASGRYSPGVLRTETFLIPSGVQVYGGFAGNETQLTDRVLSQPSSTTFTGETGDPAIIGDNNRHVVTFRNASASTRLDGIVITGGNADTRDGSADGKGGGIYCDGHGQNNRCEPYLTNCLLSQNYAASGGGLYADGDWSGNASPTVTNCVFDRNTALSAGGGANTSGLPGSSKPIFIHCQFTKNVAGLQGGGLYYYGYFGEANDIVRLTNCIISENTAPKGAGVYCGNSFGASLNLVLTNCLVDHNRASDKGGAIGFSTSSSTIYSLIRNCTFNGNQATNAGGTFFAEVGSNTSCAYTIENTIIRNGSISYGTDTNQIPPTYTVTYSNIQGGFAGAGNIDADPQFVDAANGNYRLLSSSPSVNTGDPNSTTANVSATDLVGNPRVQQNRIDMGAYEFQGGTEIYTVMDGNWNTPSVWSVNRLPTAGERIQLRHRISLPPAYQAQAGRLGYDAGGQLIYSAGVSLRLTP